ncbi:MAG TPA: ankyrin repeat domain-containing protein [Kofleriaceae bacterium]|jgi:ankyrin repeat protein|nr:ankyrin repeat domain-containing protein [Kofleriaceae bacterium]
MDRVEEILAAETPAFARAVRAIITGDVAALRAELAAAPDLIHARSASSHRSTLLHYVAANGIEDPLQRPVANADDIARMLIAAGASVDAPCNAYDGRYPTTLSLLVSSDHPAAAGVSARLVHVLCDAGAAVDGVGGDRLPLSAALLFGKVECVDALIARGASTDNIVFAAAGGQLDWVQRWLDRDPGLVEHPCPTFPLDDDRAVLAEQALVFASLCGRTDVVRLLLDRGTHIDATPPGSHWTATALHAAAGQGQRAVVELLLERGADPSIKDVRFQSTALGWARHLGRDNVVDLLTDLSL